MSDPLTINWLVPEPFPGAGGDVGLFRLIRYLAEFGHHCRVYVVPYNLMNDYSTEEIRAYIGKHFGPTAACYEKWCGSVAEADGTVATFWPTVENVLTLPNGGRRFYLVQDFEPSFYPDEPEHAERAEQTYRAGFHCLTLGRWLAKLLRARYGARADYFDFAVDPEVYWPRLGPRTATRRVCFYARSATPRRGYEVGIEALRLVKSHLPNLEIVLYGTADPQPRPLFPFVDLGLLQPEELATLFSGCEAGLVLSLSNPSFVPLEMMACRCAVVEIASERMDGIATHGKDAWLVEPSSAAIAEGLIRLLTDDTLRTRLIENAHARARSLDWRHSARQIEAVFLRELPAR
jgi:glycosyltransferase involved in cell wall biosynthesis